jgi:hypothetical protein
MYRKPPQLAAFSLAHSDFSGAMAGGRGQSKNND